MSIIGRGATINKPGAVTHGDPCVIRNWDQDVQKYCVMFDGPWCGWYHLSELTLDKRKE